MGACLPSTQLLQLPLLYNGLPRGCWSPLVGAHTCPSPGPLPSGCGSPALSGPRRSRAQSSFGQLSASPLSCQSKPSYTRWGLGRAVRGRKKQLRGQSGVRAAGCPPQPPSVGFLGTSLVLASASVSPCALIELLFSFLFSLWVGLGKMFEAPSSLTNAHSTHPLSLSAARRPLPP